MKRFAWFGLLIVLFAASGTIAASGDAQAQKRGGKSGGKAVDQKAAEQTMKKAEQKKGETAEEKGEAEEKGKAEKKTYQPKKLNAEEMKQWQGGTPPGWTEGAKKGWGEGATPPGEMKKGEEPLGQMKKADPPQWQKWDENKKQEWQGKLEQAKERIRTRIRENEGKGETNRIENSKEYEGSAVGSVEGAARMGVPVEHAEAAVQKGIERGMTGEEIEKMTRAMSYGADKGTNYDELGAFVDGKMAEGERGDELAGSIYKKIDDRSAEQPVKEQTETKKEPWYKRLFKRG